MSRITEKIANLLFRTSRTNHRRPIDRWSTIKGSENKFNTNVTNSGGKWCKFVKRNKKKSCNYKLELKVANGKEEENRCMKIVVSNAYTHLPF